jgi:AraC-like DNA-binding protein
MLERYFNLLTDDGFFELRRSGGGVRIQLALLPVADHLAWRCAVEWSIGSLIASIRALTAEPVRPLLAEFQYDAPEHAACYREVLQCPVRFAARHNALVLNENDLERPIASADRSLRPLLQSRAEDRQLVQGQSATMTERVQVFLRARPAGQTPNVRETAKALGVSVRTMARRLESEGTSFRTLLDLYCRDVCCQMLSQPAYTIEEIALVTGYSEMSPFYRAFKRWTDKTPAQFRRETSRGVSPTL